MVNSISTKNDSEIKKKYNEKCNLISKLKEKIRIYESFNKLISY